MKKLLTYLIDLLLLAAAFFAVHYGKYGTFVVGDRHDDFLVVVLLLWLVILVGMKPISLLDRVAVSEGLRVIVVSAGLMLGAVSLVIVFFELGNMSRVVVYGTIFLYAGMEAAAFLVYGRVAGGRGGPDLQGPEEITRPAFNPSVSLSLACLMMLVASFGGVVFVKRGTQGWSSTDSDAFFVLVGLWMIAALVLRKFQKTGYGTALDVFAAGVRSTAFMALGLAVVVFGFRFFYLSRGVLFGTLVVYVVAELVLFYLYHRYRSYLESRKDDIEIVPELTWQQSLDPSVASECVCSDPVDEKIRHALGFFEPELYEFIRGTIDLTTVDFSQTGLMHTDSTNNLRLLEKRSCRLLINLHKINDIRSLNPFFHLAYTRLAPYGFLVGKAHTLETHRDQFFEKYPDTPFGRVLYGLDFVWHRVFPKLPAAKKVYFAMTRGKNRLLSKAEVLGRLCFCGFRPVAETTINKRFYFITQKDRTPSKDPGPTYGPLVKLKRIGYEGRPITVHKFRTMHPYSEYIQDYVYNNHQLEIGGKIKDDYRVTSWGRFMRRYWLDELPMLYNWLRGDVQLVGVRPLSHHYLELYTPELRRLRTKVKPGLLPPYYADMPETLDAIMASERRYIESYLEKPLSTQVDYFLRCFFNILIEKKRSA